MPAKQPKGGKIPGGRAKGQAARGTGRVGRKVQGRFSLPARTKTVKEPCPNTGRGRKGDTCGLCGGTDGDHGMIDVIE